MNLIQKEFKTLKQAENFMNRLYSKYNSVELIQFPKFSENGIYIFKTSKL